MKTNVKNIITKDRVSIISKRVDNIRKMSDRLFHDSDLSTSFYRTYSNMWDLRISLYDGIIYKN